MQQPGRGPACKGRSIPVLIIARRATLLVSAIMLCSYRLSGALALALGCTSAAVAAVPAPKDMPDELAHVLACRAQTTASERLACFDQTVAVLSSAVSRNDVKVIDKQEINRARHTLFGFSLPNLKAFGLDDTPEAKNNPAFTTLQSHVRSARKVAYGRWDIELDEHAVWRNLDQLDSAPPPGADVTITKGMLSFFMKIGDERPVRAERLR